MLALKIGSRYNSKTGYFIRDNLDAGKNGILHLADDWSKGQFFKKVLIQLTLNSSVKFKKVFKNIFL